MAALQSAFKHADIMVGFKPIDDLHREFQAILDTLNAPGEADYGEDLLALHEHLLRHFATEEQYMLQENYLHYERHKRAHEHLLESCAEARRRFDANDIEGVQRYSRELMGWFAVHAQTEDAELAGFLRGVAQ
jgi:hemerythrin